MKSENQRLILAIVLTTIVMVVWQKYFTPPITNPIAADAPNNSKNFENKYEEIRQNREQKKQELNQEKLPIEPVVKNQKLMFQQANHFVEIDNSLRLFNIKNNLEKHSFSPDFSDLQTDFLTIELKNNEGIKIINFPVPGDQLSKAQWTSESDGYRLLAELNEDGKFKISISHANPFNLQFRIKTPAKEISYYNVKKFQFFSSDLESVDVGDEEKYDLALKWFGVDFNYHLFGIIFSEKSNSLIQSLANGTLTVATANPKNSHNFYLGYFKKDYDYLQGLGDNLHMSIDYGFWSLIAVPMLRGLQFFYGIFPNWGLAIILLTIFIRMLTLPLQMKSFKSMKKMQIIQPELQKIREKYKEDPQRMQRESMELFKRAGANPMGGCLPLLLQLPIFVAFYQMLNSSIELVNAPFILWIQDLSTKDPYYVLPVLMGASMFLQQKFTPTQVTDPVQKKVFMFMPLIFAVMMKDLPAGMNLYIFVSTLVGVAQQVVVQKRS